MDIERLKSFVMTFRFCLLSMWALVWAWVAGPAGAAEPPAVALPVFEGALAAGAARSHPLPLAEGDFVAGQLDGQGTRLVLLDREGRRVRVLSRGRAEREVFMFIAGADGPYWLDVRAPNASAYRLAITRIAPAAAQRAPEPVIESPALRALGLAGTGASGQAGADTTAFWVEVQRQGAPLVEREGVQPPLKDGERLVTFLWRGAQRNVRLVGGPSNDHDWLQRLPGTDIWFRSYRVPASLRLSYRLAPDVPDIDGPPSERRRALLATAQTDPLNPRSFPARPLDRFNGQSLLELPEAPTSPWLAERPGVPRGTLQGHRLASQHLGNERDIHLYRSAGWRDGAEGQALVVLFDADRYLEDIALPTILDNLVVEGRLPPVAAIFIANPSNETRSAELPPNPRMARFMAEELMPWARTQGLRAAAAQTVIAGASYGGLAAAWMGLRHPEWFGAVYSQSGSFWWAPPGRDEEPEWLTRQFAQAPPVPVRFLLEAGLYETGRNGSPGILDGSRHLRDVLQAKGHAVRYRDFASGHDNAHWRVTIGAALEEILGGASQRR